MKKLISLFLFVLCACSLLLCGCTKANNATFKTIVGLYQQMADNYNNESTNKIFYNGLVKDNGAHFLISYNNENLNNCIAQINAGNYSGEDLTKYKRYAMLSNLSTSIGTYSSLLNSVWYQFYFCCDRDILDNPELNNAVPQEIKKNMYVYLTNVNNSINAIIDARRTLESITNGSTFSPVSAPAQNSLTNYFSKLNNLLIQSLNFNVEFERALSYGSGEPKLDELPKTIQAGSLKVALDRVPLRLSQFFINNNLIAGEGLDKLSEDEEELLTKFKNYFKEYQLAVTRENISQFEDYTGAAVTTTINITYTNLRNFENEYYSKLPTFLNSANSIKSATEIQKTYYNLILNNFESTAKTYFNYSKELLDLI